MSDIERLRQDVINAAREYKQAIHKYDKPMRVSVPNDEGADRFFASHNNMIRALNALDEAEKPDPWQLLRESRQLALEAKEAPGISYSETDSLQRRIELALEWRDRQEDA